MVNNMGRNKKLGMYRQEIDSRGSESNASTIMRYINSLLIEKLGVQRKSSQNSLLIDITMGSFTLINLLRYLTMSFINL